MKKQVISKRTAVDLIKALAYYQGTSTHPDFKGVAIDADGLSLDLEEFVTAENEEDDSEETEEDDEALEGAPSEEDQEEPGEQEDDEGHADPHAGEEAHGQGKGGPEVTRGANCWITNTVACNLKPVFARIISSSSGEPDDEVQLHFRYLPHEHCNFSLVVSDPSHVVAARKIRPIVLVRRFAHELHVLERLYDGGGAGSAAHWHRFSVSRFPVGWAATLPLGENVKFFD